MGLVGANPQPKATGLGPLPEKTNYFLGNDASRWRTGVPNYSRAEFAGVYPGIDLVYYGNQRQLEYDWIVRDGANPRQIRMRFQGAANPRVEAGGDLVLNADGHEIRQRKPVIYQTVDGRRKTIRGRYILRGREVAFDIGNYDKSQPLVIDPVLVYSTYLGGFGNDNGQAIAIDVSGNTYIAGSTNSTNFPVSPRPRPPERSAVQLVNRGGFDAFIVQLSPTGARIYGTFLGGSGSDSANGIRRGLKRTISM